MRKIAMLVLLVGASVGLAPVAQACDVGSYYDPRHEICQNTPPAYPEPGYNWLPSNGGSYPGWSGPGYPSNSGR